VSTHDGKIVEMPKIAFPVERFVYQEVSSDGVPRHFAERFFLSFWNDGKFGRLPIYPGLSGHTEQLAGRHEKVCLPLFETRPW